MSLFPLLFSVVMIASHGNLLYCLWHAFAGGGWHIATTAGGAVMLAAVFHRPALARSTHGPTLVGIVYLWIGLLLLLTIVTVARHGLYLAALAADHFRGSTWATALASPTGYRVALALGLAAFLYSLAEAAQVRVKHLDIVTDKLPAAVDSLRIVALSDIHITRRTGDRRLEHLARLVNRQNPDITVLLGDTVDDRIAGTDRLERGLAALGGRLGRFSVMGNHEWYQGIDQSQEFLDRAGFTSLRGTGVVCGGIRIVGVDDPAVPGRLPVAAALAGDDPERFVLLLTHRPETPADARGRFDLQLAGHTHGGQVWPVRYLARLQNGHHQGLTRLPAAPGGGDGQNLLYVLNGAGYWGPPVRFLTPPDILVIDLHSRSHG
ncbi:MAG: metallophosphoesterase [Planctomycetes bacterium]|nr:metallophosphoesterase [Planctomycetota bacterium]